MKHLLTTVFLFVFCLSISGQMRQDNYKLVNNPEVFTGSTVLLSAFAVNESIVHTSGFKNMPDYQKRNVTNSVYVTGAITSVAFYFGTKYFIKNKSKIKRKISRIFH